jgi:Zn-dependent peptidase ImmA (M78 family)
MNQRVELARRSVIEALRVRKSQGLEIWQAICVYDLAEERLGIRVLFDAIPSMEGMYMNGCPPRIILSSLRPSGRMVYTCAHEVGHHIFAHGTHVDEIVEVGSEEQFDEEEYLAECFAGFLLMPKLAVSHGFAGRGWNIPNATPEQFYTVAGWLGVGYTTLITHMCSSLKVLPSGHAERLCKIPLRKIRESIIERGSEEQIVVVDRQWFGRPIDMQVGDLILFRHDIEFEGRCIEPLQSSQLRGVFRGVSPGIGRCYSSDGEWAEFVRVSRREYIGQCKYRHLEEP